MTGRTNLSENDKVFEAWFGSKYLYLILGALFVYTSFPILAPILMKLGFIQPAKLIYWVYSFFCHQLPYRSWFLFGRQPYYPLSEIAIQSANSFESVFHLQSMDADSLRGIIGNTEIGYKMAFCERDFAMYSTLFFFGLIYAFFQHNIKRIPLWIWLLVGVLPLGLDGLSQFLGDSYPSFLGITMRESTPLVRSITGGLFGFFSGWYIFPTLDSLIKDNQGKLIGK